MVASRKAGAQPFLAPARIDSTSSSAASKSAWSSTRVSERRAGRPSYSLRAGPGSRPGRSALVPSRTGPCTIAPSHRRGRTRSHRRRRRPAGSCGWSNGPVLRRRAVRPPRTRGARAATATATPGVQAEPAHQAFTGLDRRFVETPRQLLIAPSGQHRLECVTGGAGVGRLRLRQPQPS